MTNGFYSEKVIDGVLCWKTEGGVFTPYTPQALTTALVAVRAQLKDSEETIIKIEAILSILKKNISKNTDTKGERE